MIKLEHDRLIFAFPDVHEEARCSIHFQRTLRIPDDGKDYPLPPGLGAFPLRHLDDYAHRLPVEWLKRGGVITPMHQSEAMWISFGSGWRHEGYPFAVKVATGKINAITGEAWSNNLNSDPQDYAVLPEQPWLDGYCVEKGVIRQFVAMPLGSGYSVEEQLTGAAEHGGVQLFVHPMKGERYERLRSARPSQLRFEEGPVPCMEPLAMGLAPGGRMKQEIYDDPYGLDAWDQRHSSRCFVTIANSLAWHASTGELPPNKPPSAADYTRAGLPWFDYYDENCKAVAGSSVLRKLKGVLETGESKRENSLPENESIEVARIVALRRQRPNVVRETQI